MLAISPIKPLINMTPLMEKAVSGAGVDENIFSKEEQAILTLSEIPIKENEKIIWRGTSIKPHTLYRGMSMGTIKKDETDAQKISCADLISQVEKMKSGDKLCFKNFNCSERYRIFTSYDPLEAGKYSDFENFAGGYVKKRVFFEIEIPRNSHMYLDPDNYRSAVSLPVENIYELTQDPKIVKADVINIFGESLSSPVDFLYVKMRLVQENL